ncbi:Bicoid-interacting protein 3-domain-containing protein [Lentinula aciculospora]|uniref:RNA methyltransferase n=1 Tax=Lentinula aciculospora TaxID=153920 RepID=A0A9W8ZWM0_9AGAR|nr:Bicoid-interacting protein 3-domain-containing protein [Lentinula aciculospora]
MSLSVPIHGNYHGYYLKRPSVVDPRLALLPANTFAGKRVLDIGCNEGRVTCEIAQAWGAHKVVGVDIDDTLIRAAWKRRQLVWSLQKPQSLQSDGDDDSMEVDNSSLIRSEPIEVNHLQSDYFPAALQHSFGLLPIPPSRIRGKHVFPHNVSFRTADWTTEEIVEDADGYDVIVGFSISKWIHIHGGDDGLRAFFRRVYSVLKPGGIFILEPQEWYTYKKAKRLHESLRNTARTLELRPSDFEAILEGIGFSSVSHIGITGEGGFRRTVDLYVKQHT